MGFALFAGGFGENSPRAPYLPVLWKNRRDYETSLLKVSRDEFRQKKRRELPALETMQTASVKRSVARFEMT